MPLRGYIDGLIEDLHCVARYIDDETTSADQKLQMLHKASFDLVTIKTMLIAAEVAESDACLAGAPAINGVCGDPDCVCATTKPPEPPEERNPFISFVDRLPRTWGRS